MSASGTQGAVGLCREQLKAAWQQRHDEVLAAGGSAVAVGVRAWQRHRGLPSRTSGAALALLLALGAGHGVYWLITTALR